MVRSAQISQALKRQPSHFEWDSVTEVSFFFFFKSPLNGLASLYTYQLLFGRQRQDLKANFMAVNTMRWDFNGYPPANSHPCSIIFCFALEVKNDVVIITGTKLYLSQTAHTGGKMNNVTWIEYVREWSKKKVTIAQSLPSVVLFLPYHDTTEDTSATSAN